MARIGGSRLFYLIIVTSNAFVVKVGLCAKLIIIRDQSGIKDS